jgi:uncharacterized repeat protein (TIGR02543 family)
MIKYIIAAIILISSLMFSQTSTPPAAGDGSSGNPYQIANLENLYWIGTSTVNLDKHYTQTADIDASETSTWNSGAGWTPIGTTSNNFTGSYDGQDHNIAGLYINRAGVDYQGLFSYCSAATIMDLSMTGVSITARDRVGAIAGTTINSCTLLNLSVTGNLTGNSYIGGIAGYHAQSKIINSEYDGTISASGYYAGGIAGYNYYSSEIQYSRSSGTVSGSVSYTGGLAGGNIYNSKIGNSYSRSSVTVSGTVVGGLAGYNDSKIDQSYSTGLVSGGGSVGGLVGTNTSTVSNSFWDTQTSAQTSSAGGTGKTTALMKTESTFTSAGWNFIHYWDIDGSTNSGYPFIRNLTLYLEGPEPVAPSAGDGSEGSPYEIATVENLAWLTADATRWAYHYIQTEDIYITDQYTWFLGKGWEPLGRTAYFTGSYDGQEHIIDGLYINDSSTDYKGFIARTQSASVSNLGVTNVDITGKSRVGGLIGYNYDSSTVTNCYSTGKVHATQGFVGGFVGYHDYYSNISKSYSTCSVTSESGYAGGFTGYTNSDANITNCYSRGPVTGTDDYVGGFVGRTNTLIKKCYATGYVDYGGFFSGGLSGSGAVYESYWDIETTGKSTSPGAGSYCLGKTTAEMKTEATFLPWPGFFDFEGETANGTDDIWDIDGLTNDGYPFFFKVVPTYELSVLSSDSLLGTASDLTNASPYEVDTVIDISAVPEPGYFFTGWSSSGGGVFGNADSTITTFTMPEQDVTITAKFETKYTLTVNVNNAAYGSAVDVSNSGPYFEGETIIISATPLAGYIFTKWTNSSDSLEELYSNYDNFIMPAENLIVTANFESEFSGGSGTEFDQYLISDAFQLNNIRNYSDSTNTDLYFLQTNDIDLSSYPNWEPIGMVGTGFDQSFWASFDGAGFNITGLNIDRTSQTDLGLFGVVRNGNLKNINIVEGYISGDSQRIGLLAGYSYGGSVENCSTSGTITSSNGNVGGLIGHNLEGNVSNSNSSADVNGDFSTGGLIGFNRTGIVINSFTTGIVNGSDIHTGGLIGQNDLNSSVSVCYSSAEVTGRSNVGGLVGENFSSSNITKCYSTGNVESTGSAGLGINTGGLVGINFDSTIENSYSLSSVIGNDNNTGGLVGNNYQQDFTSVIDKCYSTGNVSGAGISGGLCGANNSNVTNSFWDTETSGLSSSNGGEGKSTSEMNSHPTYETRDWDFKYVTTDGTEDIWYIDTINNSKYPWLTWQNLPLQPPTNYTIISTSSEATITWDGALGATYDIYSSEDPNALFPDDWTLEVSGETDPSWIDNNVAGIKGKYYRSIAVYPSK